MRGPFILYHTITAAQNPHYEFLEYELVYIVLCCSQYELSELEIFRCVNILSRK